MRFHRVLAAWGLVLSTLCLGGLPRASADVTVSSCGAVVPQGEVGALSGDLDCNGTLPAVVVEKGAVLDLAGHTLTVAGAGSGDGVACSDGRCSVLSSAPGGRIVATDVTAAVAHVVSGHGKLSLRDLAIEVSPPASAEFGARAVGVRIDARSVQVSGAAVSGLIGPRVKARDVILTDNWIGLQGIRVSGLGVTATGGGYGIVGGDRLRLVESEAHGAQYFGMGAEHHVVLVGCDATGNNLGGLDGDVASLDRPKLVDTVCGTSHVLYAAPGTTWGVCQND